MSEVANIRADLFIHGFRMDSGWIRDEFRTNLLEKYGFRGFRYIEEKEYWWYFSLLIRCPESTESMFFQQISPESIRNPPGIHPESMSIGMLRTHHT